MSSTSTSLELCIKHLAGHLSKMDLLDRMDTLGLLKSVAENPDFYPKATAAIVAIIATPLSPIRAAQAATRPSSSRTTCRTGNVYNIRSAA